MHRSSRLPAGLLALAALAASANEGQPAPSRGELKVTAVEGDVKATPKGGAAQPIAAQAVLHEGDVVDTGPDGRVELVIATGTVLRIGPSAHAELREAPLDGGRFKLKLAVGNLWAHVAKLLTGDRFEVETENGVAGVRGTEFTVGAATGGGDDLLRVYEGAVQCDHIAGKWSKRLEPGKELLFHRDRPTTLRGFDVAEKTALREWKTAAKDGQGSGTGKEKKGDKKEGKKEKKSFKERVKGFFKRD